MEKEEELQQRLLVVFKTEVKERLQTISSELLGLEKETDKKEIRKILEVVYRDVHSLKGAARSVDRSEIEVICQEMETIFAEWKKGEWILSSKVFDILHIVVEGIGDILSASQGERDRIAEELKAQLGKLEKMEKGENYVKQAAEAPAPAVQIKKKILLDSSESESAIKEIAQTLETESHETVRISKAKLELLLRQAEEMLVVKLSTKQHSDDLKSLLESFSQWKEQWEKLVGRRNSHSVRQVSDFQWHQDFFESVGSQLRDLVSFVEDDLQSIGRRVGNLLEETRKILLFPFSTILQTFPKMVRDLCREQEKEVNLVIKGGEFELDKRILEEIKDPLIHLVRNCIDHGLEKPAVRISNKKTPGGTIQINISQIESDKVKVDVSDDGIGIDFQKVKEAAVKKGVLSYLDAEKSSDQDIQQLIFQEDVTTSPLLTRLSGRGLGMAIVKENVEKLGGQVFVHAEPGKGTLFTLLLPLSLATFRGVLIRTGGQEFIIPTLNIERAGRIRKDEVKTVEKKNTISVDGKILFLVRMEDVLELQRDIADTADSEILPYVILSDGNKRIAFNVEQIMYDQDVLVRNLSKQLVRVRNIGGATVLGSGKVVPVLNVSDLLKEATKTVNRSSSHKTAVRNEKKNLKKILVVEDSITSRTLLVNILESSGFLVKTAVDGVDGFTALQEEKFDLVVSDIQMPRMDGFELTEKIRNNDRFSELPVVIVTALETREDRERGITAGANAYIVKSSFDQSNLLEVVRRLL